MTDAPADASENRDPPFAARYGLVRPLQGRYVAGSCAALGRATGTDPVLWRVVLAVLVCFGGTGALIYLVLWLATPEEGDTASPAEALLGRGHSNTSPVLTGLLGLVTVGLLAIIAGRPFYLVLLAGTLFLSVVLLANRSRGPSAPAGGGQPPPPGGTPTTAPPPVPAEPTGSALPPGSVPVGTPPQGSEYRPPFAPHGPFAAPPPSPPPPPPPRAPRERSVLGLVTFFATLVALGLVTALDLVEVLAVPAAGYVATALAVVGAGLLIGTWLGRARPLIALGTALALALPAAHAVDTWQPPEHTFGTYTWTPRSVEELRDEYHVMFGEGRLDLRELDPSGEEVDVRVAVSFGTVQVLLPGESALRADTDVQFGEARVMGDSFTNGNHLIEEPGAGDPDAGTIRLDLQVRFGEMEVYQ